MSTDRLTRVNELLRREIGTVLYQVMHEQDFDMSAVTVTHVVCSSNLRRARVLVSIRDHQADRKSMLSKILKHRREIQSRINKDLTLKYTPRLFFELDGSVAQGDHLLEVLQEMEDADPSLSVDPLDPDINREG